MIDPDICEHDDCKVEFDERECIDKDRDYVRKHYPRFYGECPDCGASIIRYASFLHYIMGDWR